jgi:hypothetical protein
MNKKGVGAIGAIMLFVVFIVMWFVWLGGFVADIGSSVVESNNLTGIEGFFFANLNLTVFICLILGMVGWFYFGGSSQ